ncbi:MAG: M56 family metallopeptidase [Lachnospiraceae bacterium]|nr:MAG: M56 family metallopeptidase [Lachnospiraceae bacterium]
MLKNIFVYLLHNSIAVCVVILTVFAVRLFLRRAPKKYSYILWAIVGIYLLCPIRLSSPISIYSLINNVSDTFLEHHSLPLNAKNFADKNKTYNEKNQKTKDSNKSKFDNVSSTNKNQKTKQNQNNTAGTENISQSLTVTTTAYIWLFGCIVLLVRNLFLIWRTKQTVLMAIRRKDNIYESEYISTPFVLGIVRPKIYIPFNLSEQEREYILKHEQYHIRRKDQIIKICAYILCVIYWFQPLIWFAYFVMIRDMEMSCDEYVLKNSKSDIRAAYSTSLLKLATKTGDFNAGLPAFGESDIRKRVKNIMKFNAKKKWVSVVAAIAVVIVGVSCLTKTAVKTDANKPDKIIAEKKIGPDNNKMTYGDKIDSNIKAADTSNNEKAINNIKDNSTADETDMDSDDIVPITKNIYSIDKINKSSNPLAVSILKKVRQVFPKEVYQEMMWHGKMYLAEFKQGDISCSITNKNKADNLYLDLYFNGDGTLESMLNQSTVRNVKKTDKNTEINKIVEFAKVFLNSDVIYTDNKNSKNNKKSSKAVMITEGKLPERYDSSGCLSAYKDNHGNAYLFNRNSGMVMSFYMDE